MFCFVMLCSFRSRLNGKHILETLLLGQIFIRPLLKHTNTESCAKPGPIQPIPGKIQTQTKMNCQIAGGKSGLVSETKKNQRNLVISNDNFPIFLFQPTYEQESPNDYKY